MPDVYRVHLIDVRKGTSHITMGHLHIHMPRDGLVHIVDHTTGDDAQFDIFVWPNGTTHTPFQAHMICGNRTKMHGASRSRHTQDPVTCLTCLGGL